MVFSTVVIFAACDLIGGAPIATKSVKIVQPASAPDVVGPDDLLDVQVWKQKDLSGPVTVAGNGDITLPLLGEVKAADFTTEQLQSDLATRYGRLVHNPNVMVRIIEPRSRIFYVTGEVIHPGVFALHSGEVLSQAIAEAGGLTQFANPHDLKVVRRDQGRALEVGVDYRLVESGKNLQGDIPIERGDTILVP